MTAFGVLALIVGGLAGLFMPDRPRRDDVIAAVLFCVAGVLAGVELVAIWLRH